MWSAGGLDGAWEQGRRRGAEEAVTEATGGGAWEQGRRRRGWRRLEEEYQGQESP